MVRRISASHMSDLSNLDGKDGPGFALTLPGFDPASFASSLHNAVDHQKQRFDRPPFAAVAADSLKAPASAAPEKKDGGASSAESAAGNAVKPTLAQYLRKPIALFSFIPKDAALFFAGAVAGGTAKTVTAPLDRWKLMLQVRSVQVPQDVAAKPVGLLDSFLAIGRQEGVLGYWKGNLPQVGRRLGGHWGRFPVDMQLLYELLVSTGFPYRTAFIHPPTVPFRQVIRIIPYSAVQLFAYEMYKKAFLGKNGELSVPARLAAGACAGMTSTLITYPLDVLRLRLAVDPASRGMRSVAMAMIREEGVLSFYKGLAPSLISIAPYIALNFCAFDLIKRSIPEKYRKTPQASFVTALCTTTFATVMCYLLDTVRCGSMACPSYLNPPPSSPHRHRIKRSIPEKYRKTPQASFVTALCATTFATVMCYPLDTVRRQMQMKGSPFTSVFDAIPGIIARDGVVGLYRGFIANALKNLPNSRWVGGCLCAAVDL
ncbi:unnamed protein product [Closterium sp. Yama58-4]|nr:unnamed protein product [Closterium sp. Yama58-4]